MATIRASCPTCGDVELTTADVQVRVCSSTDEGAYLFGCPICRMTVTKPADQRIIDLLLASGVRLRRVAAARRAREPRNGPPISYDDLLEFHFELQQEGWFERMATKLSSGDR